MTMTKRRILYAAISVSLCVFAQELLAPVLGVSDGWPQSVFGFAVGIGALLGLWGEYYASEETMS